MSIGRTILDCKLALCHLASDMKYAGAVYEARTYGSVRGMRRKPHPTRYALSKVEFTTDWGLMLVSDHLYIAWKALLIDRY
jgi:hypothetical protein